MENVRAVKAVLRSFEMTSGLRINFAKSQFGAVGQSERIPVIVDASAMNIGRIPADGAVDEGQCGVYVGDSAATQEGAASSNCQVREGHSRCGWRHYGNNGSVPTTINDRAIRGCARLP